MSEENGGQKVIRISDLKMRSIPIKDIDPAPYNPRIDLKPGDPKWERLKASMEKFGLVEPLVWNERNGVLVGGHQRLNVLIHDGATRVKVSVVDLDEVSEKELNLSLNKNAGDWDKEKLEEMPWDEMDVEVTGFSVIEVEALTPEPPEFPSYDDALETEHKCPRCEYEW